LGNSPKTQGGRTRLALPDVVSPKFFTIKMETGFNRLESYCLYSTFSHEIGDRNPL